MTVIYMKPGDVDEFNNTTLVEDHRETVDNVIVSPVASATVSTPLSGQALEASHACYFPRSWAFHRLRGALVGIRGRVFTVLGDPEPFTAGLSPTGWYVEALVKEREG